MSHLDGRCGKYHQEKVYEAAVTAALEGQKVFVERLAGFYRRTYDSGMLTGVGDGTARKDALVRVVEQHMQTLNQQVQADTPPDKDTELLQANLQEVLDYLKVSLLLELATRVKAFNAEGGVCRRYRGRLLPREDCICSRIW